MLFHVRKYLTLLILHSGGTIVNAQSDISLQSFKQKNQTDFQFRKDRIRNFVQNSFAPVSFNTEEGRHVLMVDVVDGIPVYISTLNSEAAATTGVTQVQKGGTAGLNLEGDELLIGVWDDGSVKDHIELSARVISKEVEVAVNHATHVTGTIIASGVNPGAKGMAPKASVTNWYFNNDLAEMAALAKPDDQSLLLSNHSYGTVTGWTKVNGVWNWSGNSLISSDEDYRFGFYGEKAAALDELANLAPYYTIVWAAGNDRTESGDGSKPPDCNGGSGYDCIIPESVAKNIVTVGAIDKIVNYTDPSSVVMSNFSSWGPTDDGRIKPDLVGAGVNVFSSIADGTDSYAYYSGTSMATPNVTGSLALLQELYKKSHGGRVMKASTLKALAIHTAKEAGILPGPDYKFGWGVLDVEAAARLLVNEDGINTIIREGKLLNGTSHELSLNPVADQKITITIAWNDPAASPVNPSLDPINLMLVNDLDIKLVAPDGSVKYPWLLDPAVPSAQAIKGNNYRDNVEKLEFNLPEGKPYQLIINHKGQLVNGSQDYSLIIKYQSSISTAKTLYWIGDSGNWHDESHWSLTSGGTPALILPGPTDRVIVDENSFDGTGLDQIALSQNAAVGSFKWLRSEPAIFSMQGHLLTISNELVLASESIELPEAGVMVCNSNDSGNLFFTENILSNLVLNIEGGEWTMRGKLTADRVNLNKGKLTIDKSSLILNQLNSNSGQSRMLTGNNSNIQLNESSTISLDQFSIESTDTQIQIYNSNVDLNWDGVSFAGKLDIKSSQVNANGNIMVDDLSINAGSGLTLQGGSEFHADTISWLKGEENQVITLTSATKSTFSAAAHFLLCTDYVNISNVDFVGSARIYVGLNSVVTNAANWSQQTCSTALFADFDVSYLCQNGFTAFQNTSRGEVELYEWNISGNDGFTLSSNLENPFFSFDNAGAYTVTLTITNGPTSHTYQKQIEIEPGATERNKVAVNAFDLISLATASSYQWFVNEQKEIGAVERSYPYNGREGLYRVVTYDGLCNRASELVTITGLKENDEFLNVYPNPAHNDLMVEVNSGTHAIATLTDLFGRVLVTTPFISNTDIPVKNLNNGLYLLKVKTEEKELVKKIIISH